MSEEIKINTEQVTEETPVKTGKIKLLKIIIGVSAVLIAACLVLLMVILKNPEALFKTQAATVEEKPQMVESIFAEPEPAAEEPEEKHTGLTSEVPDSGILNILLCGIDAYENGSTTSGTMPHTDANIVISINFDENRVDLTSILRDTFTENPQGPGFYKFNSIFNINGGLSNVDESMQLTCRAAENWMGGISIPYYYVVDFQAVMDLIDNLGGIDFYVDVPFEPFNALGTWVWPGWHHLNGAEVMGYIRIRIAADGLDSSRTERQRKMMVAIFEKLQDEGLMNSIPLLIHSIKSGVYTNTNIAQTTALANYAMNVDRERIYTHSLVSNLQYNYDWIINFVKMDERAALLKEIYGIDAEPVGTCSPLYEQFLYNYGFGAIKYYRQAEKVLKRVKELTDDGLVLNEDQKKLYNDCYDTYQDLVAYFNEMSEWCKERYNMDRIQASREAEYRGFSAPLNEKKLALQKAVIALQKELCPEVQLLWRINMRYDQDSDINQVVVDFG